jgi:DNA repair protein RecO (recombination protein O)
MPSYNTLAIVLRRLNYGETDKILTLFSRDRGRLSAIAKGARKAISRLSGATEVLTCTRFQLATGKSMEIVTQVEVEQSFSALHQDLPRLAHGLYLTDLIDHSIEDEAPNPELFDLLLTGLLLVQSLSSPELAARWFEIRLLGDLGYAPNLRTCAVCDTSLPGDHGRDETFALSASQGGALCPRHALPASNEDHSALSYGALRLLQALEEISPAEAADTLPTLPAAGPKALNLARLAMRRSLRFRLERDLKSLEFLDSLQHV